MNNIKIIIYEDSYVIVRKFIKNNIYYKNMYVYNGYSILDINILDLYLVKKLFKKVRIYKYLDINYIKYIINKYYISFLCILISVIICFILSDLIFEVNVDVSNKSLKYSLIKDLDRLGVKKYKFKLNYNEKEKVKKKLLKKYKDNIEWLEIENIGTTYNIKVVLRKQKEINKISLPQDIIAKKDGIIKKIIYKNGVSVVNIGDYVKKGDILISGKIIKGEDEVKDLVNASGKVYAEVWYKVSISIPYNYNVRVYDKKFNRYYLKIFNKDITLVNYYKNYNYKTKKELIVDKIYLPFKIYKEEVISYKYKNIKLNKKNAYDLGISKCIDKVSLLLKNDEYIISKKVLKKEYFSSKIYLEVFVKTFENITKTSEIELTKGSD